MKKVDHSSYWSFINSYSSDQMKTERIIGDDLNHYIDGHLVASKIATDEDYEYYINVDWMFSNPDNMRSILSAFKEFFG